MLPSASRHFIGVVLKPLGLACAHGVPRFGLPAAGLEATCHSRPSPTSPTSPSPSLDIGSQFKLSKEYTKQEVQQFVASSGDSNPIHVEDSAAQHQGAGPALAPLSPPMNLMLPCCIAFC